MFAAAAQETGAANAPVENDTLNNTVLNNTALNNSTISPAPDIAVLDIGAAIQTAQNLSTVNGQAPEVAAISDLAGPAPLVAAGASSAQVASEPGSYKIGTGVGGFDVFNPEHMEVEPLKVGIPIKPMRDTGKMFFVCDIV
jgi:hypothetical protein